MKSIYIDNNLRVALHSIYVAQFRALKAYPKAFDKAHATRMLTSLMAARPWSWRVIGITKAALDEFAKNDFKRPSRQLQRGHKYDRSSTAQLLYFDRSEPMPLDEFYEFFLERDKTVIMTNAENKHTKNAAFPAYIEIDINAELFPSGSLIGWQHRKNEMEFLQSLHAEQKV